MRSRCSRTRLRWCELKRYFNRRRSRLVATLTSQHVAPEAEHEKAVAILRQAQADVEGRKVDVARVKLNLDYATVRTPIDGVVGAALMSEGSLVVQNDAANLATIQQLDPIDADFTQSVDELSQLRRAFEKGDLARISPDTMKVRLVLDDGSVYPLAGRLLFSEAKVDVNTGQVTLRGEFPNPKHELLPGMYIRVQIEQGIDSEAIAVPQQAIQRDNGGGRRGPSGHKRQSCRGTRCLHPCAARRRVARHRRLEEG